MSKITLDAETFKALASATRLTVLKALDERRKTLTELAHELQLNKATVHEHLALLLAADLVRKRDDEGRKWIYYELTWTGQSILRPEATTTFNVLLGLSALAAGGGVFMLGRAMDWWLSDAGPVSSGGDESPFQLEIAQDASEAPADQDTSAGSSASGEPTAAQGSAQEDTARDTMLADDGTANDGGGLPFFDDGGWIALALLTAVAIFLGLALFLTTRLRAKPFDPESAARAEAANPPG